MAEYIKRETAVKVADKYGLANGSALGRHTGLADCIASEIANIPAADVVPVVHGRWEYNPPTINTYGQLKCSICNWWTLDPSVDRSYSYCPNCGAKMDGGVKR